MRTPARRSPKPAPAREIARPPRARSSRSFFPIRHSARDYSSRPSIPEPRADLLPLSFLSATSQGVENKNAHIQELMRRYKSPPAASAPAPAPAAGYPPAQAPSSGAGMQLRNGQTLSPVVSDALQRLYATGVVSQQQIDDRMLEHLASMQEHGAAAAVDELARSDLSGIRNVSAYFKTICRRHGGARVAGPPGVLWRAARALPGGALRDSA